ncbi:MAG TPA: DUF2330 domain-containing protein [Polyangiaceae bacterium]|nr:DUF2330 domain-containing protein [Polyangiaceae bacterium]
MTSLMPMPTSGAAGFWAALVLALLARVPRAAAFPGVVLEKSTAAAGVRSTSVVLMQHGGYSIMTLMAEVGGPVRPFALLVPVPKDVTLDRLRTVRRTTLARVESLSAPRLHAFYEQDPCSGEPLQQAWEEHVKAPGRGFLTPDYVPPADRHYAVSNAISKPVEPVFKEAESEFRYRLLDFEAPEAVVKKLTALGYRVPALALEALAALPRAGKRLLLAEIVAGRVELSGNERLRLGGIRFWSRAPLTELFESLGPAVAGETEDVFVYIFDRTARFGVKNLPSVVLPTNVLVEPRAGERLTSVYGALFDAALVKSPGAAALEFAWPTRGCGEPCPDVPLGPDELMTLGGDVLEAHTATARERAPEPGPEATLARERFETHLAELPAAERPAAAREHAEERREIARREALTARQTYVLTRTHLRHAANTPRVDLELGPAPAVSGGVGIPAGMVGALATTSGAGPENRLQMRFVSLYPWTRGFACGEPRRGLWGKRWASEARVSRAVPLALELDPSSADRKLLESVLVRAIPELGLAEHAPVVPAAAATAAPSASARAGATPPRAGCGVSRGGTRSAWIALVFALVAGRRRVLRGRLGTCVGGRRSG